MQTLTQIPLPLYFSLAIGVIGSYCLVRDGKTPDNPQN